MERKIYIFNRSSAAAEYGVGTYIDQLILTLQSAQIKFEVVNLFSEGFEVTRIEKDGYWQVFIPSVQITRRNTKKYYTRNVVYLLRTIIPENKNIQYIFHLNFMSTPEYIPLLRKMFNCKILVTVHYTNWGISLMGNLKQLKTILNKKNLNNFERNIVNHIELDKYILDKSDLFISVANHTMNTYRDLCKIDISNGIMVNNALKDSYSRKTTNQKKEIRGKYFISNETQIIIFAGRLEELKGIEALILAFKKIINTNPDTHLFIAGDGDFKKWISVSEGYWTKISFMGKLDKKQLYELYNIADIGIMCSLHEEFGYVAIEMMMHELPLIVSDTGGLSEIIENDDCGLKVPVINRHNKRYIDPDILAEKIKYFLDNPNYAKKIGENGRRRFIENYELNLFTKKMIDIYFNI